MQRLPRHLGTALSVLLAPFARRFIAGTTLSDALKVAGRLKAEGFLTTVDHLGENVRSAAEAKIAAEQYVLMLKALKDRGLHRNVSLKLSQLGLEIDPAICEQNLSQVVAAAEQHGGFVRVDMEGSDLTQATLDQVLKQKRTRLTPVGAAVQAMLLRTSDDIVRLLEREVTIRLCKGAYKESQEIAVQGHREVQRQFAALAKRLITSELYHGIATHDPMLIEEIAAFARAQKVAPERFEFQMLLGIRPRLQKRLLAEGWRVRIYIPFGRAWVPYTFRRMRERKENMLFVLKSLFVR